QDDQPLPAAQIALIERWIMEGAKFDGDPKALLVSLIPKTGHPEPPAAYPRAVPAAALAFSPDGKELAVGGYHEITIWNLEGKLLRRLKNVARQTHALAWHAGGTLLAAASGEPGRLGEVALFDARKGTLLKLLATLPDIALDVKFSPDGTRLASCGADNAIRIFEIPGGKELLKIEQHADWVMAVAWKSDGSEIASASRDKTARVFKLPGGELESTFTDHGEPVLAVAFAPDGKTVFTGGRDRRVFDWSASEAKRGKAFDGFEHQINQLAVFDKFLLSTCADKKVRQHHLEDRSLVRTLEGHTDWVYALAVHAPTKCLATGGYDGEVRLWNLDDGKLLTAFKAAPGLLAATPLD
ncbi:MAG: WD40 repeat domain-containing protein, partial [Verrucomicrobiota bacterium]